MQLDEVIEQLERMVCKRDLVEVTAHIDGVLRGSAHCAECDAKMNMHGQPVSIRRARLSYIERDGLRVIFHFSEE